MIEVDPVAANIAELRPKTGDSAAAERKPRARSKRGKQRPPTPVDGLIIPPSAALTAPTAPNRVVSNAAVVVAVALASVSGFFGVTGMTAIFAAAVVPVMVMTGVLEAAKLVTAAWLARHWHAAPLLLRLPLVAMTLLLMALTAIGTFGFLSRAHLDQEITANETIDRDAAPLEQRIAQAESTVRDLDGRILQLDDMVKVATERGRTKLAMALVADQARSRDNLLAQRQAAAAHLSDLRVEQAGIEAERTRVGNEVGPALYVAKLFGSTDIEGTVRLITALLVLVLDPLAVLLTIAASRRR